MKELIVECPINALSYGQVSVNILRELYLRGEKCIIFPIGKIDISVYDKLSAGFQAWLSEAISCGLTSLKRNIPVLKIYHLNGAHQKVSDRQFLLTFHETDSVTDVEYNMASLQDGLFVPSKYTNDVFASGGIPEDSMTVVPMGFDTDFQPVQIKPSGKIEFGIVGKWEKRKNTSLLIKAWIKKFGKNKDYHLNVVATNPFLNQEYHHEVLADALGDLVNSSDNNVDFIQFMKSNSRVNQFFNFIDVDLGGMSSAEGWNLPSFHMTGLGKWSAVLNATAHTEWANAENSVLVEPNGLQPIYDDIFFKKGQDFNQGNSFTFSEDALVYAMEVLASKAKTINVKGLDIQKDFTWKKTVDIILAKIY